MSRAAPLSLAVVGAGWAGCAAAVGFAERGYAVSLFEAAPMLGGRARTLETHTGPDTLDNGQHIMIGAYADTLRLMRQVGIDKDAAFLRMPFTLKYVDGTGLAFPSWPAPLNAVAGIACAQGWSWGERLKLLRWAAYWQFKKFECAPNATLADICGDLPPKAQAQFITPLCLSALNTPVRAASAQVFLRVLRDAMFRFPKGSDFLLPRLDFSALFPQAAARYVQARGGRVVCNQRVQSITHSGTGWLVDGQPFDRVVLGTTATETARLAANYAPPAWLQAVQALQYEAIATVYASSRQALPQPMLALADSAEKPAQFVFDRGQLLPNTRHLLAFVISVCALPKLELEARVLAQAKAQLGLDLELVKTVIEKRATIAATPAAQASKVHLTQQLQDGLQVCGDYLHPYYPSTIEGAVQTAKALLQ